MNIYAVPHKGLRLALGQLCHRAGSVDWSDPEAVKELHTQGSELFELLALHLNSEEEVVLPAIEAKVPGSTEENHDEHLMLQKLEDKLADQLDALAAAPSMEKALVFYDQLNHFLGRYFQHMEGEEGQMNKLIWDNFNDEEIAAWHGTIMSKFTPDQVFSWFKYIIPALHPAEQNIVLGGFKANAPTEVYQGTLEALKPFLSQAQKDHVAAI